ncbi:MAG: caspase family protein [Nitratireductor sp.]
MQMRSTILLLAGLLVLICQTTAFAEKRVALVIGNAAYVNAPELANPRNDAAKISARLAELGFEIVEGVDADLVTMLERIDDFARALEGADVALFYYAGHGLQVNGRNYMVPVDAALTSHIRLDYEAIPIDLVMASMQDKAKTNLLFLDACRDNPLARSLARSLGTRSGNIGNGLARIGAGRGTLISYATEPGNVALDGKGANSPYTEALAEYLGQPGMSIGDTMILVRNSVMEATYGRQVPWEHSSLTGRVILGDSDAKPKTIEQPVQDNAAEIAYWDTVKDSEVPDLYTAYLARYPQGLFSDLAKVKIDLIEKRKQAETERLATARKLAEEKAAEAEKHAIEEAKKNEARAAAEAEAQRAADELKAQRVADLKKAEAARLAAENSRKVAEAARLEAEKQLAALEALNSQRQEQEKVARLRAEKKVAEAKELELASLEQTAVEPESRSMTPQELARATQTELQRLGCLAGRVDGKWGSGSERSLRAYADKQGLKLASLAPDEEMLGRMKAVKKRVCPLVCGRGEEEKAGRCVKLKQEAKVEPKTGKSGNAAKSDENNKTTVKPSATVDLGAKRIPAGRDCYICKYMGRQARACIDKGRTFNMNSDFPITTGGGTPGPGACTKL